MDFEKNNLKEFQINGTSYAVHNFVLQKAGIFNILDDIKDSEIHNFDIPNATKNDIQMIFGLLYYDNASIFKKNNIAEIIRISSIMTYMAININLVEMCIGNMLCGNSNVIEELLEVQSYHDCINLILKNYTFPIYDKGKIIEIAICFKTNMVYLDEFKINIINKLICKTLDPANFDIITGITQYYDARDTRPIKDILDITLNDKGNLGLKGEILNRVEEMYLKYLGVKIDRSWGYTDKTQCVIYIIINKINLYLLEPHEPTKKGTIGCNIMMTIVNHLSKILLGLVPHGETL